MRALQPNAEENLSYNKHNFMTTNSVGIGFSSEKEITFL
jgi:uncharacterized protein YdhG (YjbR/CyaY superfamily)